MKFKTLLLFLILFSGVLSAQRQVDVDLAEQFFGNGEFEKAIELYEKLFDESPSDFFYTRLLETYIKAEEFKDAERLVKQQIRKQEYRLDLLVDLGYLESLQGNRNKAEKEYKNAISSLDPDIQQIANLANAFIQREEYDFAEASYLEGRKLLKNDQQFNFELARLYSQRGETQKMLDEYLNILSVNRAYIQSVQNLLLTVLNPDPDGKMREELREKLLRRIQKQPNEDVYSELLIWLFIQNSDFAGAFIQSKALDRRKGENGQRIYSLAKLSTANEEYDIAEKSYRYLIEKGEKNPYYLSARMDLVDVLKKKVTKSPNYSNEDLLNLEAEYQKTIKDLGRSSFTFPMLIGLAELDAFYLNNSQKAIKSLEEILSMPGLKPMDQAETKLLLGDIMLTEGEIWESSLLYSQVEKSFKYDEPGERAKFKNAKIAFYTGDFKWAQAQLDVLKGSTSKLIANDAMDLSLLITDNTGLDSITEPLEMYAKADLMLIKKQDSAAISLLDSIPIIYPETSLKDDILYKKYKISMKSRNYEKAEFYLEELIANYAWDILGDDAIYHLAKLNEEQFKNTEKAQELYKKLLFDYPASLYVVDARKRFRKLRGDQPDRKENETIILN